MTRKPFELHLRHELPNKISSCRGNCHRIITQSDRLLVRSYDISCWLNHKTGKEQSRHGPLSILFQDSSLKAYDSKNYYSPNEHLDEGTRKKLSDVDIVYLEDLGIN